MEIITSRNNYLIKDVVRLRDFPSFRRKTGLFFIEGIRLCLDAASSGLKAKYLFVTEKFYLSKKKECENLFLISEKLFLISDDVSEKISDTKNPQGIFLVVYGLDNQNNINKINFNGKYIAFENLQNPDNLGAAARTAEALGLDGLIVSGGCDVCNPKALRASMGSLFRLNVILSPDLSKTLIFLRDNGMSTYAAVVRDADTFVNTMDVSGGIVCAVGNEGNGLSEKVISSCMKKMTIPMKGRAESLNASQAATIIMWEMMSR